MLREQLSGVHALFLPCGTWILNSGYQVWQQGPLPSEPFSQHQTELLLLLTLFVLTAKLHLFILCVCVSSMCIYVVLTCMQDIVQVWRSEDFCPGTHDSVQACLKLDIQVSLVLNS